MGDISSSLGISMGGLIAQLINFAVLGIWLVGGLLALWKLRGAQVSATAQVLWVILILILPALGTIAFWIVQPHRRQVQDNT